MSRSFSSGSDHLDNAVPAWTAPPGTIACWAKFAAPSTASAIVTLGTSASGNNRFSLINQATGAIGCTEVDASTSAASSLATVADTSSWHLCVGTWTDHTNRAAFLDGINKGTIAALKAASAPNVTRVSANPAGVTPFSGLIAHIAIWNIVLSDTDVLKLLTQLPNTVQAANLLEYWPLTGNQSPEPSSGTVPNNLIVTGTTFSTDNPTFGAGGIQFMSRMGRR